MPATQIPQSQIDKILAHVMEHRSEHVKQILERNGYAHAKGLAKRDLQTVFLKAIKDSEAFRNDVSSYLAGLVKDGDLSFIGQPAQTTGQPGGVNAEGGQSSKWPKGAHRKSDASPYLNEIGDGGEGFTAPSTSTTSTGGTSFFKTLGSVVNKDTLTSLFNTGLSAVSTSLQAKAAASSEANALELERIRLQQIQAQAAATAAAGGGGKKGLSTGAIIGIAVGGVAVLGTVIYLATKKK